MFILAFYGARAHWPENRHDGEPKPKSAIAPASRKPIHERGSIAKDDSSVMPLVYLQAFGKARPVGRILFLYRVVILLPFACAVVQHCFADNLRTIPLHGVYLTHDGRLLQALARRDPDTYWIDGYRMSISNQTQICWHNAPLQFGPILNRDGLPISRLEATSPCENTPPAALGKRVWLQYIATQKYHFLLSPLMKVAASRIDVWGYVSNRDWGSAPQMATGPAWQTLCTSPSPHKLRYPNEGPIDVVCDAKVNSYIENVFSALLRLSATTPDGSTAEQEIPSFYVVRPFQVGHNYDFETLDGADTSCYSFGCGYKHPRAHSTVREVVYAPDGTVLIPDTALAHLGNEAECAALLSYSLAASDQHLIQRLFRVQRFKGNAWTLNYKASGRQNEDRTGGFIWLLNEQVLRLGIRQMYLAGYDIRYAPLAWAVEQGTRIRGSADQPHSHMAWDASYAFNDISQLYPDADYGKLKRGEKEYAAFLDELRKADPEAFAEKK